MAINPQAREAVLRQMSEVPELRDGLAQMAGRSSMTQNLAAELQRLNPKGYNRYNPSLGKLEHNLHSAGWGGWQNDPAKRQMIMESDLYKDIEASGRMDNSKHFDVTGNQLEGAAQLRDMGITDFDDIGVTADANGNVIFYNKLTGQQIANQLRGYKDKGQTTYYLNIDEQGNPYLDDHFQKDKRRSGLGKIAPGFTNPIVSAALGIGAGFLAPGLGSAIAGSLGTSAATGAALAGAGLGGLHAGITGGNVLKSAALGGLGGGLGTYLQSAPALSNITNPAVRAGLINALTGTATGALGSALYGGDVLKGGLTGALTGGVGGAAMGAFGNTPAPGQQLSPLQQMQNAALGYAGRTAGGQLASNLIGSPYNRPATPQPQNTAPVAAPQPAVPTWLPQHVQQSILGMQGAANG